MLDLYHETGDERFFAAFRRAADWYREAIRTDGGLFRDTTAYHGHEHFTLYHHQGSRPEYYSTTVFVSIPLAKVQTDTLTIVANTYDGPFSRTFIK